MLTKREIKKLVADKVKEGKTHQEIFDEIRSEHKLNKNDLKNILKNVVTLKGRKKYRVENSILMMVLLITVVLKINVSFSLFVDAGFALLPLIFLIPLLNVFLLYAVAKFQNEAYYIGLIFSALSIVNSIKYLSDPDIWTIINFLIIFIIIILCM